jgi:hypothetical protein
MNEELREKMKRCIRCEEPDTSHMGYIGNKFPLEINESGVSELSEREVGHGYQ